MQANVSKCAWRAAGYDLCSLVEAPGEWASMRIPIHVELALPCHSSYPYASHIHMPHTWTLACPLGAPRIVDRSGSRSGAIRREGLKASICMRMDLELLGDVATGIKRGREPKGFNSYTYRLGASVATRHSGVACPKPPSWAQCPATARTLPPKPAPIIGPQINRFLTCFRQVASR